MDVKAKVFGKITEWGMPRGELLAVAFSGGGDSTALLSLMVKWNNLQSVQVFIVDHGLRVGSAKEAETAQDRATSIGASARILTCEWPEGIPTTGIQEKARNARYQLLGDACREQGINTLMLGHNQDDQAETVLMRQEAGSGWRGLAAMKARCTSPVWPALQGINVVRPLLGYGRTDLRSYNKTNGLKWISDPSNANKSFARIRAREYLAKHEAEKQNLLTIAKSANIVLAREQKQISAFIRTTTKSYEWGGMALLPEFRSGRLGRLAEALKYLLPAISGEALAPPYDKRINLARRMGAPDFTGATLGGVRLVPCQRPGKDDILCVRDLGKLLGRHRVSASRPMGLQPEKTHIWDGRFSVSSVQDGVQIDALGNWLAGLDGSTKRLLAHLPEAVRGGLPVFIRANAPVHIPFVDFRSGQHGFDALSLLQQRLEALLQLRLEAF